MKLKTGYSDLTPDEAAALGDSVYTNMNGVAKWAAFAALIAALPAQVQAVRDAQKATGPSAEQQLEDATSALIANLGAIADDANRTQNVTDADLASTTLPPVKERTPTTDVPPAPTNLRMRHGNMPGSVDGTCDAIPGGNIRGFEGQWTSIWAN
jgi:hypothetical protein